jgi:hypothetical protein
MPCEQFFVNNPPLNPVSGPYNSLEECEQGCNSIECSEIKNYNASIGGLQINTTWPYPPCVGHTNCYSTLGGYRAAILNICNGWNVQLAHGNTHFCNANGMFGAVGVLVWSGAYNSSSSIIRYRKNWVWQNIAPKTGSISINEVIENTIIGSPLDAQCESAIAPYISDKPTVEVIT